MDIPPPELTNIPKHKDTSLFFPSPGSLPPVSLPPVSPLLPISRNNPRPVPVYSRFHRPCPRHAMDSPKPGGILTKETAPLSTEGNILLARRQDLHKKSTNT